jgi:hypothetical protein
VGIYNTDKPLKFLMNQNFVVLGIDVFTNLKPLTLQKVHFRMNVANTKMELMDLDI